MGLKQPNPVRVAAIPNYPCFSSTPIDNFQLYLHACGATIWQSPRSHTGYQCTYKHMMPSMYSRGHDVTILLSPGRSPHVAEPLAMFDDLVQHPIFN
jgi:hypothetical protein